MRTRIVAALDLALLLPAALFMAALAVRSLGRVEFEPAHGAQEFVMWYARRMWTLWVLLLALPFTALLTGCATIFNRWNHDPEFRASASRMLAWVRSDIPAVLIVATTMAAGGILTIVVLHMAAN